MFSFQEYIIAWLMYLVSVAGLLMMTWTITCRLPWGYLQQSLRLIVATFLLLPAAVENSSYHWAPAWIKAFLQLVFGGMEGFLPVGRYLLIVILVVLLIYCLLTLGLHMYRQRSTD